MRDIIFALTPAPALSPVRAQVPEPPAPDTPPPEAPPSAPPEIPSTTPPEVPPVDPVPPTITPPRDLHGVSFKIYAG